MDTTFAPLAPLFLARALVAALAALPYRGGFVPGVGMVKRDELKAAMAAGRPAYRDGDRAGAVLAMARTLYAKPDGTGFDGMRADTQTVLLAETDRLLEWVEGFHRP